MVYYLCLIISLGNVLFSCNDSVKYNELIFFERQNGADLTGVKAK